MRRQPPVVAVLAPIAALVFDSACARPPKLGDPLKGLTREQRSQFDRGRHEFERVFTPETGLGPLFNSDACAQCHESPVVGGSGDEVEVHATAFSAARSSCDPLAEKGGFVIQQKVTPALKAALGIDSEPVPAEATGTGKRTTPRIFGLGLLDAVPDDAILGLARWSDRGRNGVSGRPNRFLDGRLGRFGRKAMVPTLKEFIEGAYVAEQGITNPAVPTEETVGGLPLPPGVDPVPEPEIDRQAVDSAIAFVRFLAPPAPKELTSAACHGKRTFYRIGCADCHVAKLRTGGNSIKALAYKKIAAYTDLLIHDMGPDLADICLGRATPSEFRTEPLMGLRFSERFLHDGRASSIAEAIRLHGGEASRARSAFEALSDRKRKDLLEFLSSL